MKKETPRTKNVVEIEIPVKGSLGLLAYGDKGVKAWREARIRNFKKNQNNTEKH
jgi:hypothetical protein